MKKTMLVSMLFLSMTGITKDYTKTDKSTGSFTKKVPNMYISCEYDIHGKFIEGRLITIKDNQVSTISSLDENTCSIFKSKG